MIVFQSSKRDTLLDKRQDGRSKDEHRLIFMKTGVISQARGSAYVEQGQTKVMCGVYGPREIPRRSDFSMNGVLSCRYVYLNISRRHSLRIFLTSYFDLMILISISHHTSSFSRAPFASPQRKAPGSSVDDSEEKEMAIALKEALEATICMVSFLVSKELGKRRNRRLINYRKSILAT